MFAPSKKQVQRFLKTFNCSSLKNNENRFIIHCANGCLPNHWNNFVLASANNIKFADFKAWFLARYGADTPPEYIKQRFSPRGYDSRNELVFEYRFRYLFHNLLTPTANAK